MKDSIVNRLMRNHKKIEFLSEDILYEADDNDEDEADEDSATLPDDDGTEEHDDSQAPIQGDSIDDFEISDDESSAPPISHRGGGSHTSTNPEGMEGEEESIPEEGKENLEDPDPQSTELYDNPLDNQYAIHYTLGSEVLLNHTGDTNDTRSGVIDGYDTEGFYRILWSDGTYTNGLTDIALKELINSNAKKTDESACICGSSDIVRESGVIICDNCGRKISENAIDALTLADKDRPEGKRMIRSEAHPISTAVKPSIAEAIKKAFNKGNNLLEGGDPYIREQPAFNELKKLDNTFWYRREDMIQDIEDLGYEVVESDDRYVVVSTLEDEDSVYQIPVVGTSRTLYLDFSKAKFI